MIVVIEGARGVGKTTFAKCLVSLLKVYRFLDSRLIPIEYTKFTRGSNPHNGMKAQVKELSDDGILHIVDRFHITEFVMRSSELNEEDAVKQQKLERDRCIIAKLLDQVEAKVYILTANTDVVFKRVARRKDPNRRSSIDESILAAFEYVAHVDNVPLIVNNNWWDMVKGIARIISDIRRTL